MVKLVDGASWLHTVPPTHLKDAHVHTEHAQVACLIQPRGCARALVLGRSVWPSLYVSGAPVNIYFKIRVNNRNPFHEDPASS